MTASGSSPVSTPEPDRVLGFLRERLGLDLWMLNRHEGGELRVVATAGLALDLGPGSVLPWEETLCARMVAGGPRAAPDVSAVPVYAAAPIVERYGVGCYIGVPITVEDEVAGALCGLACAPQRPEIAEELPLLELCAELVGRQWETEARLVRSELAAATDALTGLANRYAWESALEREENRYRRFGHPAAVLAIDLDGFKQVNDREGHAAGDERLVRTARAIAGAVREHDLVARWGGDEFTVLAVECDAATAERLRRRVRDQLTAAGVEASVGLAVRGAAGLHSALAHALADVGEEKPLANAGRGTSRGGR